MSPSRRSAVTVAVWAAFATACAGSSASVADPASGSTVAEQTADDSPVFVPNDGRGSAPDDEAPTASNQSGGATEGAAPEGDDGSVGGDVAADASSGSDNGGQAGGAGADGDAPVAAAPASTTTTMPVPLVPDTGVPGIDSDNLFCRSWSEFAGSFRAIGIVSAIRDGDAGQRLEVIASEAVIDAIDGMDEHLPAELEPERDILLSGFAGPFGRRALRANEALAAAGIGGDDFDVLAAAWLDTLADVGIDDPSLDLEVPAGVDAAGVEAAAAAFIASTPPVGQDPSLTTFIEIPLTDAYTLANCPDAGTLSGSDDL